jgi:RecB family endonuclease NucS
VEIPEQPAGQQGLPEQRLEGWLAAQPDAIRDNLLIIGKQVPTASGPLELLAITADGQIVVVEFKRVRAPRETVAQAIDHASWIADHSTLRTLSGFLIERPDKHIDHQTALSSAMKSRRLHREIGAWRARYRRTDPHSR